VAQGQKTTRRALTAFGGSAAGQAGYVTKALIAVNVVVMVFSAVSGGATALVGGGWGGLMGSQTPLTVWGSVLGYAPYVPGGEVHGVAAGEGWRLLTAMFLHYGALHLLMNMYALWILGRNLEAALGPVRYLGLYLLAGLGGNVAAYVFTEQFRPTAGASTAVFGLFAALFVLLRRLGRDTSSIVPVIVVNVVFTLLIPNISIPGHFGGLVTGAAVAAVLAYAPRGRRAVLQGAGCGVIAVLLLVAAAARTGYLLS
jgi:membrane associated rhomboid family serine protease